MVLAQTDVSLPGVLALAVRRVHVSSYRAGRLFGPSWASSLDQRLEFDEHGVVYVADDGMRLVYPTPPANGAPAMPEFGPRWPLARTESGYTISQPQTGRTLHFPERPAQAPISSITDRNGNRIDFQYDPAGVLTAVAHSGGYQIAVRSERARITELRLVDQVGGDIVLARYRHNDAGHLIEVINSSGRPLTFEYDGAGRVTRWEDRNGQWYRYLYDAHGRCVANEGAGGFLDGAFHYDPAGSTTRFTDSLGHVTTYEFDESHNVIAETDPLGRTTRREWDRYDRLLSRTDPLGGTARYRYDEDGNLVAATQPDGTQALAEYNEFGQPTVHIDPDGAVWRQSYDSTGNLIAVTDPAGATTRYERDDHGAVIGRIDPLGNTIRIEVNACGLPVAITDAKGAMTRYERDQFGRIKSVTDALGGTVRLAWTVEGKLLSRTYPDGRVERWCYDGEGSEVEHVDVRGQVTRTETTHFDLVSARVDPTGARTEFSYDTNLRLTAVTNPEGMVWSYEYDPAGNVVREQDFTGRTISYRHDDAGDLVERVNGAGQSVRFGRDGMGRVVERRSADAVSTFGYDPAGRLMRAVNVDADLTIQRDVLGQVIAETVNGATTAFRHDALGRVVGRRTPTGAESTWAYDPNGRPVSLRSGGRTVSFGYDPLGREIERLLDTGTVLAQVWDGNHRLISQTLSMLGNGSHASQARLVQQRRYHYRADNYPSAIEDRLSGVRRFDLDAAGRVTAVEAAGWREHYAYDGSGNLVSAFWPAAHAAEPGARGAREYAGTLLRSAGDVRYQHDRQGRVVMRQRKRLSRKPDTWHYAWDADDRLVGVVTPDGARWRYRYDALGRRIAKQRLGPGDSVVEQITFSWEGTQLAEQVHSSGRATTWNFDGNYRPVTQLERVAPRDAQQGWIDAQFFSIVTDLIGTPTELVDPEGNLAWQAQTTLWGLTVGRLSQRADTALRFPGQYHDPETGLNYNYFRYYDPENGRYESSDPLGLRPSINPYGYVPNPHRMMDPVGLMTCDDPENVLRTTDPYDPAHQAQRSAAWRELYVGEQRRNLARQAANDIRRGRGGVPSQLEGGRVDAPQGSVPGSQYHAQGPGEGSPGLNLDGTFHDGDPGWNRRTYEWLYNHGWSWPRENPPPGNPPTHHDW
jgi:RHS repeat-associated protein